MLVLWVRVYRVSLSVWVRDSLSLWFWVPVKTLAVINVFFKDLPGLFSRLPMTQRHSLLKAGAGGEVQPLTWVGLELRCVALACSCRCLVDEASGVDRGSYCPFFPRRPKFITAQEASSCKKPAFKRAWEFWPQGLIVGDRMAWEMAKCPKDTFLWMEVSLALRNNHSQTI